MWCRPTALSAAKARRFCSRGGHAEDAQDEGHVLEDGLALEELEVLEDDADRAAQLRDLAVGDGGDVAPAHQDLALRGQLLAEDELEERRLARARTARSGSRTRPCSTLQGHVGERHRLAVVLLVDVEGLYHRSRARAGRDYSGGRRGPSLIPEASAARTAPDRRLPPSRLARGRPPPDPRSATGCGASCAGGCPSEDLVGRGRRRACACCCARAGSRARARTGRRSSSSTASAARTPPPYVVSHRPARLRPRLARRAHEHARLRATARRSARSSTTPASTPTSWPSLDELARRRRPARRASSASRSARNLALLMLGRRRERAAAGARAASPPSRRRSTSRPAPTRSRRPGNRPLPALLHAACWREGYRRRHRARPDLFAAGRERGLRTVREYDDRITAPFGGYESAAQYYERSSAGPWLASIDRPTLVLAAADDPMIPVGVGRALAALAVGAPRDHADRRPRRLRGPLAGPRLVLGRRSGCWSSWRALARR